MYATLFLIFTLSICAAFIQRVSGFGFGIFVMMFFPYLLPSYGESTMLSGLLAGTTALFIAIRNWQFIEWKLIGNLLLFNLAASYISIEYMASLGNETLKRCFGVMFILVSLYFLLGDGKIRILRNRWSTPLLGMLSGIMGGMFAMPGPPIVLYCIERLENKRTYITTLQAFSVVLNIFYTIFRGTAGFFSESTLLWWSIGVCGAVTGSMLGEKLFKHIEGNTVKKIVYMFLLVSGIITVL